MISVVIPCYNSGKFVSRAIRSVLDQTWRDWELILVNNASTDNTQAVLEAIKLSHPDKIKVLFEAKRGAPAARNCGLRVAKGEWVQFLDADDELLPEKLEGQYKVAQSKDPVVVVSPCRIREVKQDQIVENTRPVCQKDVWQALIASQLGITSANLWRRQDLLEVGGWDEDLVASQEYDLLFRLLKMGARVELDLRNMTVVHMGQNESVSRSSDPYKALRILEARIELRQRIKEFLKLTGTLSRERSAAADAFIFQQLYEQYRYHPEYVKAKLRTMSLTVPFRDKMNGLYFMFKMDVKRALKIR